MNTVEENRYLRVGVTGGIGSGKSTVCALFAGLSRFVIKADEIARRLVDENHAVKGAIESEFGPQAYLRNGALDRKRMAAIVFNDEQKRRNLDSIVHPEVFSAIEQQLDALSPKQSFPYILIEAALIYESGMEDVLDYVLVVMADEETCIQRVIARDNVSREEVLQRIASQMAPAKKAKHADFVVRNDGQAAELRSTVLFLDTILSQLQQVKPS